MIIDAHQHFWKLSRGDYGWLTPELAPIYQDFMPDDLRPILKRCGVSGTILVQAAPTIAETEFLLELADAHPFILGVVGWVDFETRQAPTDIARLANHPKLVGLRPMIQDIGADDWILRGDLEPAVEAMIQHNLTFDALVQPRHLQHLLIFLHRYPGLRSVIDHCAKPELTAHKFQPWADEMRAIAAETTAFCKLSGLLTEAGTASARSDLPRYVRHLLSHFGPDRIIWGSDWPVLKLADEYDSWLSMARTYAANTSQSDKIFRQAAMSAYDLHARGAITKMDHRT